MNYLRILSSLITIRPRKATAVYIACGVRL